MFKQGAGTWLLTALQEFREQERHATSLAPQVVFEVGVVALAGQDDEVARGVVGAVAVLVVDDFAGQQRAAQQLFGKDTVQHESATGPGIPDPDVALVVSHAEAAPVVVGGKGENVGNHVSDDVSLTQFITLFSISNLKCLLGATCISLISLVCGKLVP